MRWPISVGHHDEYQSYWVVFGRFGFRYWRAPGFRRLGIYPVNGGLRDWVIELWWVSIYV